MKKNKFLFLIIFVACAGPTFAQKLYMLSRGSITENDSLKGYYFLYQSDRYNKDTMSYILELYNRNLVLAQKSTFLYPMKFEFVSCRMPGSKAYVHFRNYHRDLNGNPKPRKIESRMIVYDGNKQAITKHIVFPKPKAHGMTITEHYAFTHLNGKYTLNCSYDKELKKKQVLYLLNNNLDTLWKSWLNDDQFKYCSVAATYPLNDQMIALEIAKGRNDWDIYGNNELRIISLKDGSIIQKIPLNTKSEAFAHQLRSTFYDRASQTLYLGGNYMSKKSGTFGAKYYNQGIFLQSVDLRDQNKPVVSKKTFLWKQDLKINIFDTTGKINENNEFDLKKIFTSKGSVQVLMGFTNRSMNAAMPGYSFENAISVNSGTGGMVNPFSILFSSNDNATLNSNQKMSWQVLSIPDNGQPTSPRMLLREDLCVLHCTPALEVQGITALSENKDLGKLKFQEARSYKVDLDFQYYPENASMNILALFHSKGSSDEGKPVLASLLYEQDGTCKTDELNLSPDADWTEFYKAKPGYITIVEYFEKDRRLVQRIEKLNY